MESYRSRHSRKEFAWAPIFINGFVVTGPSYDGGVFDWLTPFSLFTGLGLVVAYAPLGSTWLIMKEGPLQRRMFALARPVTVVRLVIIGIVSLWTPLTHPNVATRWFALPNLVFFAPIPVLVVATTWAMLRVLGRDVHATPFLLACGGP